MAKVLIVVDTQEDFIYGSLGTPEAQAIVPNVNKKIKEYEGDGGAIVFTRDTHHEDYLETNEGRHLPIQHCIFGTDGWEIASSIYKPTSPYSIIDKTTFGYGLWNHNRSISNAYALGEECNIEIIGLCIDICVVSIALILKTTYPEANITVDASCCAGTTPEKYKAALEVMKSCQISVIGE